MVAIVLFVGVLLGLFTNWFVAFIAVVVFLSLVLRERSR